MGCYLENTDEGDYHTRCSKKLFGTPAPPQADFGLERMEELAKNAISRHLGITGVQTKVGLHLDRKNQRFTVVGFWGDFILKPPTERFPALAVLEDLTMHLAETAKIETARHGLVRLTSGELAYITRRFDREKTKKIAVEDFCQLSGLLTEQKYKTSLEKAGKVILKYSSNPGLDAVRFFDLALFSFLTGNADMHLKNFSLIEKRDREYVLAPAYDLLSTHLLPIDDSEETALTVNGKKSKLAKTDFKNLGETLSIPEKVLENSFRRILKAVPEMKIMIDRSYLPESLKTRYARLLDERAERLSPSDPLNKAEA